MATEKQATAKRVPYIALAVRDLDAVTRFYVENFGAELMPESDFDLETEGLRRRYIRIADMYFYLMQPLRPDSPVGRYIEKHGEGIHHFCLWVDDLDASVDELKGNGLRVVPSKHDFAFVHPSSGHGALIEIAPIPAILPWLPEGKPSY